MKKYLFYYGFISVAFLVISIAMVVWNHSRISTHCHNKIYSSVQEIPYNKTGLLLGTAKWLPNKRLNYYYQFRIEAAIALYKAGKIDYILVSGDNGSIHYDESTTMQKDLMAAGVPKSRIFLDYAGFRTLDSVVRSKAIFGQDKITVISQQFHNERAIYIAENHGIDAIGFNAKDVNPTSGRTVQLRERLARVKMQLDLLLGKEPRFLGEKISIP